LNPMAAAERQSGWRQGKLEVCVGKTAEYRPRGKVTMNRHQGPQIVGNADEFQTSDENI